MAAAAILKNREIFISAQPIDRFGRNLACWCALTLSAPISNKISLFQKIQDGGNGHFENSKNCNISTTRRPILTTFSTLMSLCLPDSVCQWNFTNLKIQDGGVRHFEKLKNLIIFVTDWPILPKFDTLMSLDPLDPVSQKIVDFKNERWWRRPFGKLKNCNISALLILCSTVHRCLQHKAPSYLEDLCVPGSDITNRQHLRSASSQQLVVPRHRRTQFGRRAFSVAGPMDTIRDAALSTCSFRRSLKTFLFSTY